MSSLEFSSHISNKHLRHAFDSLNDPSELPVTTAVSLTLYFALCSPVLKADLDELQHSRTCATPLISFPFLSMSEESKAPPSRHVIQITFAMKDAISPVLKTFVLQEGHSSLHRHDQSKALKNSEKSFCVTKLILYCHRPFESLIEFLNALKHPRPPFFLTHSSSAIE